MHFWLDYGGIVMSKENPGVIFDASNSWNGYNHQGKLAILFAIKVIDFTKYIDTNRSTNH